MTFGYYWGDISWYIYINYEADRSKWFKVDHLFLRKAIHSLDGQWVFGAHLEILLNICQIYADFTKIESNMMCFNSAKYLVANCAKIFWAWFLSEISCLSWTLVTFEGSPVVFFAFLGSRVSSRNVTSCFPESQKFFQLLLQLQRLVSLDIQFWHISATGFRMVCNTCVLKSPVAKR